ncbi:MAG: hypothetical protein GQ474_00580 [Sulfurimonas sp.]|nr:hypothetical protein [Sulfurimonas sp.]
MSRLTNRPEIFPSIYVEATQNNTERVKTLEAGILSTVGYMGWGNPHYPLNVVKAPYVAKGKDYASLSTSVYQQDLLAMGIADYFNEYQGRVLVARLLGADSTVNVISVTDATTLTKKALLGTVPIFDGSLDSWLSTTGTDPLEIALTICPTDIVRVQVTLDDKEDVSIKVFDGLNSLLYAVKGSAVKGTLDAYQESRYIGDLADPKVLMVKIDETPFLALGAFSVLNTISDVTVDTGVINTAHVSALLHSMAKKSDYMVVNTHLDDTVLLEAIKAKDNATVPLVLGVQAYSTVAGITVDTLDTKVTTLGLIDDPFATVISARTTNSSVLDLESRGVEFWFAGRNVARNIQGKKGRAERRVSGVAGINHAIPRAFKIEQSDLTRDEKIAFTEARINTTEDFLGALCLTDVLSADRAETALKSFPVADGLSFIKKTVGQYLDSQMFKNIQVAKGFVEDNTRVLFEHCQANGYFDADAGDEAWKFEVYDENGDTVVVDFEYVPEGVMRLGAVRSTISKKLN